LTLFSRKRPDDGTERVVKPAAWHIGIAIDVGLEEGKSEMAAVRRRIERGPPRTERNEKSMPRYSRTGEDDTIRRYRPMF